MNHRFSLNGDGKQVPLNPISPDGQESAPPDNPNFREEQIISALRGRFDDLKQLWQDAEEELRRFRLPHGAEYCYASDEEAHPYCCYFLGFVRYGKWWRICHGYCSTHEPPDRALPSERNWKPITECPFDLRLKMIDVFDNLRAQVIQEAEKAIPGLDQALTRFRRFLNG